MLKYGVVLHSDPRFPSLVNMVAEETVHGSWWRHPRAHRIFQVAGKLTENPDVLLTKLVSGKDTYIHRRVWTHFLAVATSKDSWQLSGLPDLTLSLLNAVEAREELRTDEFAREVHFEVKDLGEMARQLERRLLVYGEDIHTQRGFHAKLLRDWRRWMKLVGFEPNSVDVSDAKQALEALVDGINKEFAAAGTLPWKAAPRRQ